MNYTPEKKYLMLPLNRKAVKKKLCFYENGRLVYDLDVRLDTVHPEFCVPVDMERFLGHRLTLTVEPEMDYTPVQSDTAELPGQYEEPWRPLVHFTVPVGHNNDPNGLVYYQGLYHLFCQHNPCGPEWGNMHWFHAVSTDLIHWQNRGIVLFPDELGMMYSGSALVDENNLTGLGTAETPPLLLFYTSCGGRTRMAPVQNSVQCIASSTDGIHFKKYEGNPILLQQVRFNRDPKVVWVPELGKYVMALYMTENTYGLFVSDSLTGWEKLQDVALEGDSECPDLFPLTFGGRPYWVFAGASDVYKIGHFDRGRLVFDTAEKRLSYNNVRYATQSYSGLPGARQVRIAWDRLRLGGERISSQMSVPMEMGLSDVGGELYLTALPVAELDSLRRASVSLGGQDLACGRTLGTGFAPLDITLCGVYDEKTVLTLDIYGVILRADMAAGTISASGAKEPAPLRLSGGELNLRIVADRCSVEVFADGGRAVLAVSAYADPNLARLTLRSDGEYRPQELEVRMLRGYRE